MDFSGKFFVRFYQCVACRNTMGGFVLQSFPISVESLGEGKLSLDPVAVKLRANLYCDSCAPSNFEVLGAQCKMCGKNVHLHTSGYMYLKVEGREVIIKVQSSLIASECTLAWCSQECLNQDRGEVTIQVLPPLCARGGV